MSTTNVSSSKKISTQDMVYAAIFAALISVLSYISIPIPISPVPVTGQSLAVMLAGIILTTKQAGLSMGTFLLLGTVGAPVFSNGRAGIGILVGPSGGYLIGYLAGAVVISLLIKQETNYLKVGLATILGGIIVVHLLGVGWLSYITKMGIKEAITSGSLPFIPGDLLKAIIATFIGVKIKNHLPELTR